MADLKCPACNFRLTITNYDSAFEWYECPKCEGCFTHDEILEGGADAMVDEFESPSVKKAVAKKKKIVEEKPKGYYGGRELETREVVNIMADEIQAIYEESGSRALNDASAQDKALQLVRTLRLDSKVKITEGKVKYVLCKDHAE